MISNVKHLAFTQQLSDFGAARTVSLAALVELGHHVSIRWVRYGNKGWPATSPNRRPQRQEGKRSGHPAAACSTAIGMRADDSLLRPVCCLTLLRRSRKVGSLMAKAWRPWISSI